MAVNRNSEYNTKLCTTLPIENAPKIKVLNNYFEESCLVNDDSDDESHDRNMDKKIKVSEEQPLAPFTIMVVDTISTVKSRKLLRVLFDTGSTTTLINKRCLPKHCKPCEIKVTRKVNTLSGSYDSTEMVIMRNIRLPELDSGKNIEQQKALVFDSKTCRFDVILGTDFLSKTGIDVKYSTNTVEWFDSKMPLRNASALNNEDYTELAEIIEVQQEAEYFGIDWFEPYCHAIEIWDAKYDQINMDEVVEQLDHLSTEQKADLKQVLLEHTKLFDGSLGIYPHKKVHIELEPNAQPKHARAYPIPTVRLETFKKELMHLVEIGVLSAQGVSEWASPTFIIPKKDNRVRWVSDLRELNKVVKRKKYPLPIIQDILKKRKGY